MLSAQLKKPRLAEMLLSKGADPNYTNSTGSALHYSVEQDNEYLFEALLNHQKTDLHLLSNKKQNILHLTVAKNAVWALPSLLNTLKERKAAEVFRAKDDHGKCPVHLAAAALRENIISLITKAATEAGVTEELLDSSGNSCAQIIAEVEAANRQQKQQVEREVEELKAKKARERNEQKAKEDLEKVQLEKVKQLQHLQKVKEEVLAEEEAKKLPFKLLMVIAIIVLGLYVLLKVGVATGATKRAATGGKDTPDL